MTTYNRNTLLVGVVCALAISGIVSYFASGHPDGLEKTQEDLGAAEAVHGGLDAPLVAFNEYSLMGLGDGFWGNAAAGIIGSGLVMGILLGVGWLLRRHRPAGSASATP
ncbi:MAG TPA: PDGLE domain-containing protein [Phycisphaerae bacterium]|nr:PDGLE domain-containing protein [Phycisphaerae bacterium]